ncbi:hypothetical protein [Mesorhizobium sp. M0809]|uniref:hypothetical protein n=1 Tax=Mesorhizobium sp. M0809 TaxID=2957003 RepID=UPI003334EE30
MAEINVPIETYPEAAQQVGIFVAHFAAIEARLGRIFAAILKADLRPALLVFNEIGGRRRREVLKLLVEDQMAPALRDRFLKFLDGPFKTCAIRRNQLVHDSWVSGPDGLRTMDQRTFKTDPMPVDQLLAWVGSVKDAHAQLMEIEFEFETDQPWSAYEAIGKLGT